jgi:hypothetical protein
MILLAIKELDVKVAINGQENKIFFFLCVDKI